MPCARAANGTDFRRCARPGVWPTSQSSRRCDGAPADRGSQMHVMHHAAASPDKAACIVPETGEVVTYRALDEASNRGAHLLRILELRRGDVIAVMLDNEPAVFEIAWAAQRAGLYLTSISTKLSPSDV